MNCSNGYNTTANRWLALCAVASWIVACWALPCNLSAQSEPQKVAGASPVWSITGPFANVGGSGVLRRTPPEDPRDTSRSFTNIWGGRTGWHTYRGVDMLGWVNLTDHAPDMACLFVARTYVYVPSTRRVRFELGVSGAARFFVNDSLLAAFDDDVFARSSSVTMSGTLWKGWNKIHVRIGRDVMPFLSFSLRLSDSTGSVMNDVDFSTAPQPVSKQFAPFELVSRKSSDIDTTFQRDSRIIQTLRRAVSKDTLGIGRLREAAWAAFMASSPDTAMILTRTALSAVQEDVSMWRLKGLIHQAKGAIDSALDCLTRAIEIDPGDIATRRALLAIPGQRSPFADVSQFDIDSIAASALRDVQKDSAAIETILLDVQHAVIFGSTSVQRITSILRVNSLDSLDQVPLPKRFLDPALGKQSLTIISGSGEQRSIDLESEDASFDGLAQGDVIVYSAEKWQRDLMFTRYAHVDVSVGSVTPTRRARVSIMVPLTDGYQFKIHNLDPIQSELETPSGMLFTWTVENLQPVASEPFMPPIIDFLPRIELSTFPGWSTVIRHMQDAFQRRLQPCSELRNLVDSLLPPETKWNKEDIATTIAHWVINSIAVIPAPSLAFTPHRACDVLAMRRGTAADKVMLASAMMAERGVEAIPTLVKTMSNITYKEPTVSMPFDHMVLVLPGDTSAQMIDLSFRPVPLGLAPISIENAFAMPVSSRMRDPVRLHKRFMMKRSFITSTEMTFDTSGLSTSHMMIRANDFDSAAIRLMARSFMSPEDIQPDDGMSVDSTWISTAKNDPRRATCHLIVRNRIIADSLQDTITIKPRWMSMPSYPMFPLMEERRSYHLVLPAAYDSVSSEMIITAPKGYTFAKPLPKTSIKLPSITYTITSSLKGQTLRLRRTVVIHSTFVDPLEYGAFRDAHRQMIEQDRAPVRLQRSARKRR